MPRALKRTLQALLVLLVIGLALGAVGGAVWLADWVHYTTYVDKDIPNYDPTKPIPAEALREDFSIIRGATEDEHGAPYLYTSKEELGAMFDAAYAKLNKPMSEIEFVKLVGPIIHAVHDGHTNLLLPRDYYRYMYREDIRIFPAGSLFTEDEVYVWSDGTPENSLPRGSKITSVDGEPVQILVQQVADLFVSTDGYTYGAARQTLGAQEYISAWFTTYLSYLKGFPEMYEVTLQTPRGEEETVRVEGVSPSELSDKVRERYPPPDVLGDESIHLYWEDSVPVLSVASFSDGSFNEYAETLERAFREIHERDAPDLIIDLRDNGGGAGGRSYLLLNYLLEESPDVLYDRVEARALQSEYAAYAEEPWATRALHSLYPIFLMKRDKVRDTWVSKTATFTTSLNGEAPPLFQLPEVTLPPYEGQVILLVSGQTFSAGTDFAAFAKRYVSNLIVVGQETGGTATGVTGEIYWSFILPNTRLRLRVPLVKHVYAGSETLEKGRGVIPDVEVWPTFEDVVEGRDRVLETALISKEGSSEINQTRR